MSALTIAERVRQAATEAGFDLAGIAPVRPEDLPALAFFPDWIAAGYAGDMSYLEAGDDQGRLKRASLAHVAPWARAVIVCALNYNTAAPYSTECRDPRRGWISRYAWGGAEKPADYHDVVLIRLRAVEARLREFAGGDLQTRCYVDTGPVVERVYARYAGIGWMAKNTCIINQRLGSWLFLGVILASLELAPDLPAPDRCGSCTRCLDACPTQAFPAPYQLDASRCISYLTIEKRGAIPEELRPLMGNHVFGCDICQDVCPWNRKAPVSPLPDFQPNPRLVNPALDWLATLADDDFRAMFRGSAVRRAERSGLRRNAALAMGNSGHQGYISVLHELAEDADTGVAEHAAWALHRLHHACDEAGDEFASPLRSAQPVRSTSVTSPPNPPAKPGSEIKRRYPRFHCDFRLQVSGIRDHQPYDVMGRCSVLSEGGVGGIMAGELFSGDVVTLHFHLPTVQDALVIRAVVRHRVGLYYGLEFVALTQPQHAAIQAYCKNLRPYA